MNNVMNVHNDNKVMYMIALAVGISNISSIYYVLSVVTKIYACLSVICGFIWTGCISSRKEEEARKRLLKNPIRMKQLQRVVRDAFISFYNRTDCYFLIYKREI